MDPRLLALVRSAEEILEYVDDPTAVPVAPPTTLTTAYRVPRPESRAERIRRDAKTLLEEADRLECQGRAVRNLQAALRALADG